MLFPQLACWGGVAVFIVAAVDVAEIPRGCVGKGGLD